MIVNQKTKKKKHVGVRILPVQAKHELPPHKSNSGSRQGPNGQRAGTDGRGVLTRSWGGVVEQGDEG